MAINYSDLFETLEKGVTDLAKNSLVDYLNEATMDGASIIANMKTDLQNWSQLLEDGEIDEENFTSLILGEKDLLKMDALMHAGLAMIRVDQFRSDICDLVIKTITSLI